MRNIIPIYPATYLHIFIIETATLNLWPAIFHRVIIAFYNSSHWGASICGLILGFSLAEINNSWHIPELKSMDGCIKHCHYSHACFSFSQVEFKNLPMYDISVKDWLILKNQKSKSEIYFLRF